MWTASTSKQSNRFQTRLTTIYEEDRGLTWCLQPILICLRLFGIDLSWKEQRSTFRHYLIRFGSLFWLIVNVSITSYLAVDQYNKKDNSHRQLKKYFDHLSKISGYLQTSVLYVAFLFTTWRHGQDLVKIFQQMETDFQIGKNSYVKARQVVIVAIALSLITEIVASISYGSTNFGSSGIIFSACEVIQWIMDINSSMSVIMFCVFSYSVALQYGEIQTQIENIHQPGPDMKDQLRSWSVCHSSTSSVVTKMNEFFSPLLLINTAATYVDMSTSFAATIIYGQDFSEYAIDCIQLFVLFYATCSAADYMRDSALDLHKALLKSQLCHRQQYHDEVTCLINQFHCWLPEISIGGLVTVSRQLIPTLIATTLTYMIILDGDTKEAGMVCQSTNKTCCVY